MSLTRAANIDLSDQRAYELACKGLLRPKQFLGPVFLDIKLADFNPPEFTLGKIDLKFVLTKFHLSFKSLKNIFYNFYYNTSVALLLALRVVHFLDVVCLHESCEALRALIHHIGEKLYSKAVCTSVHRSSDGIFFSSDPQTLISFKLGNINKVIQSINYYDQILIQDKRSRFRRNRRRPSSLLQLPQNLSNETDLQLLEGKTSGHS